MQNRSASVADWAARFIVAAYLVTIPVRMALADGSELLRLQSQTAKAIALFRSGDVKGAILIATNVADATRRLYGPDHIRFAQALNNLAIFHDVNGEIDKSETTYRNAIAIVHKRRQDNPLQLAELHNNLAAVVLQKCQIAEARKLYREALVLTDRSLGANHVDTLLVRENVERLDHYMGQSTAETTLPLAASAQTVLQNSTASTRPGTIDQLLQRCMS